MPVYNGTDAGEVIVGTSGNDTFNTSKGQDILSGDGGIDTLNADFSTAAGTQNNIGADEFGLTGTLRERDTGWITEFLGMEHVNVKGTPQDDGFYLSFDIPLGTKTIKLDAGAGFDWITLYVEFSDTALVGSVSGGTLASGNFTLTGFEQFDMRLGRGNDDLTFAAGNETIRAGEGNDRIFGGAGNDTLEGGLGGDRLDGGDGNDQLFAFDDYSGVDSGSEIDNLTGGGGNDLISIGYGDSGDGGAGSDRLSYSLLGGSAGAVLDLSAMFAGGTITVGGGTLKGFESYDVIYGSNFADTIITGDAPNVGTFLATGIQGFDGDDKITTGSGTDSVGGGAGNDTIHGGGDDDRLEGGDGNDTVYGDSGNDLVWGAGGSDELHGGDGDDRIEADEFYSANGDDKLFGEAGNDVLVGGFGANTYNGGSGDDSFLLFRAGTVVEAIGGGIDTLYADVDAFNTELDFVLTPGAEVEFLEPGQNAGFTAVNFTGNEFAQQLRGTSAANRLDGGGGADTMIGMNGNDTYFVDNAGDKAIEGAGGGVDKVFASVSYTLAAGQQLEFLATTNESGTAGINLTGNEVANTVTGNAGANRLDGGGGADTLKGLGGNDTYVVDASLDKVIETAGQGNDTVMATVSYALAAGTEVETLRAADAAATDAIDLSGNEFANNLIGNAGANVLNGGTGADTMKGGAGDDAYVVDIAGDVVVEADGGGTDEIRTTLSEFSLASTANVENLTGLGAAANKLTGNAGANRLDGRGGADTMIGGAGDDTYVVDNAADATVEAGGGGTDTVLASVAHTLAAEVENLVLTGAAAKGTGNALANVITGNAGANALDGGAGEDTLAGGEGADRLVGGAGADRLDGGPGADVIVYLAVGESTGEALDTVVGFETGVDRIDLSAALAGSVRLTAADGATIATIDTVNGAMTIRVEGAVAESDFILTRGLIFGTPEADELVGTAGADVIFGAAGADSMTGGAGNDRYIVDDPGDLVTEAPGEGTDTVESAISYALRPDVERLVLTGSGAIDGSGNTLDNLITGNGAANRLSGGEGNDKIGGGSGTDTLDGGAGNDTLDGGTGADAMRGGDGNDIYVVDNTLDKAVEASAAGGVDTVLSAVSYTLGANIEKLVLTGATVPNATGNALANALTGNGAANVL
ncbi:MAG TPA: calcium-binding protein, partial [Allosphingosinicella sp.]|nr:calcium-binding protein [Allosphingosinicella sp.]